MARGMGYDSRSSGHSASQMMNRVGMDGNIFFRRTTLDEIVDLRHVVLRAGLPKESAIFPGDELPSSYHFGIFTTVQPAVTVGCATFHLNSWEAQPAWQLRGMATAQIARGRGLGRLLLEQAEKELLKDTRAV